MIAVKFIPQLLSWVGIILLLLRGLSGRRTVVAVACCAGFVAGIAGSYILFCSFMGEFPFGIIKSVLGGSFLLFWAVSVTAIYSSTSRDVPMSGIVRFQNMPLYAGAVACASGFVEGAVCASRLSGSADNALLPYGLLALAACSLVLTAFVVEKRFSSSFTVSQSGLAAGVVALLLFSSSSILRLDLFSPLTMKVMKFCHDFVHQFFESMLIPDHLFFSAATWDYIGFLFGNGVGFWGALVIWFTPVVLVFLAIFFERLPSVAHIRQGAQRRKLIAAAISVRRCRLVIPLCAVVILAAAVYRSRFPSVEYWDPKPVPVSASPSGAIVIPKKGEVDLEDGKLHKYLFKQGGKAARFFVLMTPSGKLTVDLDACSICKPDGYGQTEGTVICYYCKTLIPLDTVGKPGGCNPVPISFTEKEDGVHIDGITLINTWNDTVQATARVKEGGK